MSRIDDSTTYTRDGETWETRGGYDYTRYGGEPCVSVVMRGDPATFFGESSEILQAEAYADGWARYWFVNVDPRLRATAVALTEVYERYDPD